MPRRTAILVSAASLCFCLPSFLLAESVNESTGAKGFLPKDEGGRALNLDFESGDLSDWTVTGDAWEGQPIKGPIDQTRPFGKNKKSLYTGEYWIGGFEKLRDQPQGTLVSAPFVVSARWCSFLLGGGQHDQTRVELVLADSQKVIAVKHGRNAEEMRPVVIDLQKHRGQKIVIRIIDEHSGGWGHVNFDDFRLYRRRPQFENATIQPAVLVRDTELYPFQNQSGDEAAAHMQVPEGFHVQCVAQEPDVRQPIAMAIDDRGRIWIAEAYAYPQRAAEGAGRDRILIFEDTDQNGSLDQRTVFVEGLNLVSGLEVGFGGVWVGASPYLMFIPDRNGNDIPDGQESGQPPAPLPESVSFPKDVPAGAEVLLDGFAWQDTHETLNAFAWGPDGWLYGCHGVFTHSRVGPPGTPDEQRTPMNAAIWRYHPVKKTFEKFIEGTSNPWGIDWNARGDLFCTACVIPHLYHLIPGGRYQRQAGQHFNSHTYDDIKTIARHRHYVGNQWNNNDRRASDDVGGGHAHAGAMIYQGGAWPEQYNGKLFMHNIHGNRINVDVLLPEGSGYAGDRSPDFLLTGDQWSQMIALQYGPDGQVWMIDWYDQQQCHRKEEAVHDRSNGRIYRVSYGDVPPVQVDLQTLSDAELIAHALEADNVWYARHARRILQERAASKTASDWETLLAAATRPASTPERALRQLWLLNAVGKLPLTSPIDIRLWLGHADPAVRAWFIRLLSQASPKDVLVEKILPQYERLAAEDPSPVVRLALASAALRVPVAQRWTLMERLVSHPEDAGDHNLPLMNWYAMEPLAEVDPQRALALGIAAGESIPLLREYMIRRLGSGRPAEALQLLVTGLQSSSDDQIRLTFLKGIRAALAGVKEITPPEAWTEVYPRLVKSGADSLDFDVYLYALGLAARFGNADASAALRQVITDEAGALDERRVALQFLVEDQSPDLAEIVSRLLQGQTLRADAIRAVARLRQPQLADAVLKLYKSLTPQERQDALNALASRPEFALRLLKAVDANQVPRPDLSADVIRQLRNLEDEAVDTMLEDVWGRVRDSDADRQALIAHWTKMLSSPAPQPANRLLGRAVFARTCQQCHTLFGTGGKVGPDITGANRSNLEYLLTNVIDPSAVMAREYQPAVLALADGRIVTGIVREETERTLTLQTPNEQLVIPRDDVDARRQSDKSMMPNNLLQNLSNTEVRALIAYVSGAGQTPMQATTENAKLFAVTPELTGWHTSRKQDAELWTVENGELVGRSPGIKHNAFLMNDLAVGDCRLTCEVLLKGNAGNSGIQFRSQPLENGEMRGYQADIGAGWWGKLYEEQGRGLLEDNDAEKHIQPNEWNRYEIIAVGPRVQTFLNGQRVVDRTDAQAAREGVIALQIHSGGPMEVRFRNLKLELLDSLPRYASAGSPRDQWPTSRPLEDGISISWKKTVLDDLFRSEGCCVADFDNDGDFDIATGSVWYEQVAASSIASPQWRQHAVLDAPKEFNRNGYSDTFMNFADDLNHDGWQDLLIVGFPGTATTWFENPGRAAENETSGSWKPHQVIPVTNNESPQYVDLNGDGRRELICGIENKVMSYSEPQSFPAAPWKTVAISEPGAPGTDRFSHGLGIGDIDQDGRFDILTPAGWWQNPNSGDPRTWILNKAALGPACAQMFVYDFDDDGDADLLSSSAHRYGIWWFEQTGEKSDQPQWKQHLIEESFSQTHALVLADINGDGLPDFVTGKRHWAHNGHDPGGDQPPLLYWFELSRNNGMPVWTKHQIDDNSGMGTQFEVADVNRDGLLDIVTSNKKGTFLFEQTRGPASP